jgi:hypothetical protein
MVYKNNPEKISSIILNDFIQLSGYNDSIEIKTRLTLIEKTEAPEGDRKTSGEKK